MKVAVTVDKPERTSALSEIFGRCNYFLLYEENDNSYSFLPNPYAKELGGIGIQSATFLIENNVDVVITKQIGKNPFRFLSSADIKIYLCVDGNAQHALDRFLAHELFLLENENSNWNHGKMRKRRGKNFSYVHKNKKG